MKLLTNLDLNKNELQNVRFQNLASHPTGPVEGQIYYNTTDKMYYGYYGSAWNELGKTYDKATSAMDGLMSKEDKSKLDGIEEDANNYVHPNHTGDVTSTGDGATVIGNDKVTNAKLANVPTGTLKGRTAAGTGDPTDLTLAAVKAALALDNVNNEAQIPLSQKGEANGVAELDETGKVPSSQLPAYVDDVVEEDSLEDFPETGEAGKIYVAKDTNKTYRWSGSAYVEISASLALGETSSTAYRGDRGKTAYDHSQSAHAPANAQKNSDILKSEIEAKLTGTITTHAHNPAQVNTDSSNRFVSDAEKATWNAKPDKYASSIGNGSATSFVVTHNLGTQDVTVTVRENASPYAVVYADIELTNTNTITVLFAVAPTNNQYRVVVIG